VKLVSLLLQPVADAAHRPAIICPRGSYSRQEVVAATARVVTQLRDAGVRRGQRVLAILDHDERALFFLSAASALGLRLLMPYNLQDAALREWVNIVETARPDHVVYFKRGVGQLSGLAEAGAPLINLAHHEYKDLEAKTSPIVIDALEPVPGFLVLFTSGTTGKPKAISISEALIGKRIQSVSTKLKFGAESRVFLSGLMNNTTGIIFSFGAVLHGSTLIIPEGRDVKSWPRQVDRTRSTHIMLRPVAMKQFIEAAQNDHSDLTSLEVVAYGAASMPRALLEEGRKLMGREWIQGYGLSETFGPFCWMTEEDHRADLYKRFCYCIGKPDNTVEVSVAVSESDQSQIGEVMVRGDGLMEGYYDVTTDRVEPVDRWLRTGDYGEFTACGQLVLKGRIANTILSENGHRIYPEEVESVLANVPGVTEAVLLGVPVEGAPASRPVACLHGPLSTRPRAEVKTTITEALGRVLSREKWPDWISVSSAPFPKSANDKVLKTTVAERIKATELIQLQ